MSNGKEITLVVDGVEVPATEGAMLVDAAKGGDVEIPVFCYEPKLGGPVGACRMCLVEVEGIPKLQTACSTPVRDGMVVYTQTERVQEAQNAVVEFLLVNHPLDCPVCDKGGECPLQDIAMGWGEGRSRVSDPKRHFRKPIPLSPLVRIDRERCILCYRCVRFSQEVAEDEQLQLLERGSRSYVGTFDDRPYIAPFHGNIIELCPVGALTSEAYRFRARPWDIEDAGSVCTLCPSQCNVKFTVRDERVARVLARDNHEVDDGWLCDKGRFGFQMFHSDDRILGPMVRTGGALHKASWDEALQKAADGLKAAGPRTAVLIGSQASNEEGYLLQRIARQALGSPHVDSRGGQGIERGTAIALGRPELSASMSRHRRGRVGPGRGHRPTPLDADPGPAPAQGDAESRHPGRGRLRAPHRARRRIGGDAPLRARRSRDRALEPRRRARELCGRRRRRGQRADRRCPPPGKDGRDLRRADRARPRGRAGARRARRVC